MNRLTWITLSCIIFLCIVLGWVQTQFALIQNADMDLLLRLRGSRFMGQELVTITLNETDIQAMGGWPITRDYYSYIIHILTEKNARVIGLDVMLDTPNRQYPEFDRMLKDFMESSRRVVLPNIINPDELSIQINPLQDFIDQATVIGFSNLAQTRIQRSVPIIFNKDSLFLSFGLALAKAYFQADIKTDGHSVIMSSKEYPYIRIPVDSDGRMLLNPTGCLSSIRTIGVTQLFRLYEINSDSLDFKNQIVLVIATAPSLPVIQSTVLCQQLPASLIHATVAENIIHRRWLRSPSAIFIFIWFIVWIMLGWRICTLKKWGWVCLLLGTGLLLGSALLLITIFRWLTPVHISLVLFVGTGLATRFWLIYRYRRLDQDRLDEIQSQIRIKENALTKAQQLLDDVEKQLKRESEEKIQISESSKRLVEKKEAEVIALEKQVRDLKASIEPQQSSVIRKIYNMIHAQKSPMIHVLKMVDKVAHDDIPVLIQGETGTGKELVARAIHQSSARNSKPFIAVNCAALSETLLESELFGHEKGAFTGAHTKRRGRFELAQGGTLFLDEITETSPAFQARLLRVLQEGVFERVGGEQTIHADVRVIAAHNKTLQEVVRSGEFREDLFFRLNGFPIHLPPLRDRGEADIEELSFYFLKKYQKSSRIRLSDAVLEKLKNHAWPGNVRELENVIRRAVILAQSEHRSLIQLKDLPDEVQNSESFGRPTVYHAFDKQILETLRAFQFSHSAITQTANALGNKDRGTITEYYRGLCFQFYIEHHRDLCQAAVALAGTEDPKIISRIEGKMRGYIENVRIALQESPDNPTCYKGLPRKFHPYLDQIVEDLKAV